jgi:hypothetical protein
MKYIKEWAKMWVAGVGTAVTGYLTLWSEDARVTGLGVILTALATYVVKNADPELYYEDF